MDHTLVNVLTECKDYTNNIIGVVSDILSEHDISYNINNSFTQIIIDDKKINHLEIITMIKTSKKIPEEVFSLLIEVQVINNKIYIRQKRK